MFNCRSALTERQFFFYTNFEYLRNKLKTLLTKYEIKYILYAKNTY